MARSDFPADAVAAQQSEQRNLIANRLGRFPLAEVANRNAEEPGHRRHGLQRRIIAPPGTQLPDARGRQLLPGRRGDRLRDVGVGPGRRRGVRPPVRDQPLDLLPPAAEGLYPKRKGKRRPVYITAEPWPVRPIRKGNRKNKAAAMADGTWPDLLGKFKPHDDRHTHSTWLDLSTVPKVLQMDRRGHALPGMDAVYVHVTPEMRQQLCDYLQQLWEQGIAERYKLAPRSAVPLLDEMPIAHEKSLKAKPKQAKAARAPDVLIRMRRQQAHQTRRGRSRG
jgi:hypothetical protein